MINADKNIAIMLRKKLSYIDLIYNLCIKLKVEK